MACLAAAAATMTVLGQAPPELKVPPQPPPASPAAALAQYPAVTAERLLHPLDGEWLMLRRTYDGWGYSPLSEITTENVHRLKPVALPQPRKGGGARQAGQPRRRAPRR
jgi:alcohol dehydrogenase (cytochrome c)